MIDRSRAGCARPRSVPEGAAARKPLLLRTKKGQRVARRDDCCDGRKAVVGGRRKSRLLLLAPVPARALHDSARPVPAGPVFSVVRSLVARIPPFGFASVLLEESGLNRLRFATAQKLLDEGARLVGEAGRTPLQKAPMLLAAQAARATHIFEAVFALCRIGRGVPAAMLNRALLEEALDVHWVADNPDIAPQFADEHDRLIRFAEWEAERKFGRSAPPLTEDEREDSAR